MKPFREHRGIIAPLETANVDTDQIIAKQFLKSIKRTGFGEQLFYDWRFAPDGKPNADFPLNQKAYQGATILLAGNNFGCGSSREHAVWAIVQFGFCVVIAPSKGSGDSRIPAFADIFRNNSVKNGLLTVELGESDVTRLFQAVKSSPGIEATVSLENQTLTLHAEKPESFTFDVDPSVRERLLKGLDDIGITLEEAAAIEAFEKTHNTQLEN